MYARVVSITKNEDDFAVNISSVESQYMMNE